MKKVRKEIKVQFEPRGIWATEPTHVKGCLGVIYPNVDPDRNILWAYS